MSEAIANWTRKLLTGMGLKSFGNMSNKAAYRMGLGIISILALFITVPIVATFNKSEGDKKQSKIAYTEKVNPLSPNVPPEGALLIYANITSINLNNLQYTMNFYIDPVGPMLAKSGISRRLNEPVQIYFGSKIVTFNAGDQATSQDVVYSFAMGDQNDYPFDRYFHSFTISAAKPSVRANGTFTLGDPVPVGVLVGGAIQSWSISSSVYEDPTLPEVRVEIIVKRAGTTKFFSMFVFVITWGLSIAASGLAVSVWVRDRQVEPPTIAVMTSMLFALPALRSTQPGSPPVGSTMDVGGFFWGMAIVAVSALSLLVNYIQKTGKPKKQVVDHKVDEEMAMTTSGPHQSLLPMHKMTLKEELDSGRKSIMMEPPKAETRPSMIARKDVSYSSSQQHIPPRKHLISGYSEFSMPGHKKSPSTASSPSQRTTSLSPLNPLFSPDRERFRNVNTPYALEGPSFPTTSGQKQNQESLPNKNGSDDGQVICNVNLTEPPILRVSTIAPLSLDVDQSNDLDSGSTTASSVSVDLESPGLPDVKESEQRNTEHFLFSQDVSSPMTQPQPSQTLPSFTNTKQDGNPELDIKDDSSSKPSKKGPGSIFIPSSSRGFSVLNHYPSGVSLTTDTTPTAAPSAVEGMKHQLKPIIPRPPTASMIPPPMSMESPRWADTRDSLFLKK